MEVTSEEVNGKLQHNTVTQTSKEMYAILHGLYFQRVTINLHL